MPDPVEATSSTLDVPHEDNVYEQETSVSSIYGNTNVVIISKVYAFLIQVLTNYNRYIEQREHQNSNHDGASS